MINAAVVDSPTALRTLRKLPDVNLVEDPSEADLAIVDPDGEGLALCSLLTANGTRVVIYAPDADEVLRLGAEVAGATEVATRPRELVAAVRASARELSIVG